MLAAGRCRSAHSRSAPGRATPITLGRMGPGVMICDQPEPRSGNGADDVKPAAKPEGRLLPWEPAHLPVEVKKEKPAEPQREADDKGQGETPRESG